MAVSRPEKRLGGYCPPPTSDLLCCCAIALCCPVLRKVMLFSGACKIRRSTWTSPLTSMWLAKLPELTLQPSALFGSCPSCVARWYRGKGTGSWGNVQECGDIMSVAHRFPEGCLGNDPNIPWSNERACSGHLVVRGTQTDVFLVNSAICLRPSSCVCKY